MGNRKPERRQISCYRPPKSNKKQGWYQRTKRKRIRRKEYETNKERQMSNGDDVRSLKENVLEHAWDLESLKNVK